MKELEFGLLFTLSLIYLDLSFYSDQFASERIFVVNCYIEGKNI